MTDIADHAEAKLHAIRKTQDGVVVSFTLHPQDLPSALMLAPLGTRYVLAFAAIGDDEQPVTPANTVANATEVLSPGISPARNPDKSSAAKTRYREADEMEQAVARSAILAKDPMFQRWLVDTKRERGPSDGRLIDEEQAADYIRWYCDVSSRKFIAADEKAFERFLEIESSFQSETR